MLLVFREGRNVKAGRRSATGWVLGDGFLVRAASTERMTLGQGAPYAASIGDGCAGACVTAQANNRCGRSCPASLTTPSPSTLPDSP